MRPMQTVQIADELLNRFQGNVKTSVDQLAALAISDGVLLENISLVTGGDNEIEHKLKRKPRLWILARQFSNATVWEESSSNDSLFLNLHCSADCRVSLWVA